MKTSWLYIHNFNYTKNLPTLMMLVLFSGYVEAEFLDELLLKDVAKDYVNVGSSDPGWTEFELLSEYRYKTSEEIIWVVPKGFVVNGASIPYQVWSVVGGPWSGRYRNAAVVHDWMCEEAIIDSNYVHRLFYDMMIESGVERVKARIMYIAVKAFGPQWSKSIGFGLEKKIYRPEFDSVKFKNIIKAANNDDLSIEEVDNFIESYRSSN